MTYNISSVVINLDIIKSKVDKENLEQVCKEIERASIPLIKLIEFANSSLN